MNLSTLVIIAAVSYVLTVFVKSRRAPTTRLAKHDDLFFVFVIPCLNEELVIGNTLDSLMALPQTNFAVLVVDDGSEDNTSAIVESRSSERVWLLRRELPAARGGKGRALNAAFFHLVNSGILGEHDPEKVIIGILDADGRCSPNILQAVAPYFSSPRTASVQVGVRMRNITNVLTRIQDFEFVTFTEIFQRGRRRVGSVGLGGNGQFTRMSALATLRPRPWTDCLTEDLDLGLRLLAGGWVNQFCPHAFVNQQAVTSFRRLVRQRSRWFQGHLQCWAQIPVLLRADLRPKTVADLMFQLTSPVLLLLFSVEAALVIVVTIVGLMVAPHQMWDLILSRGPASLLAWYLLTFGVVPFYAIAYWMKSPNYSLPRALAIGHLFSLYAYLWFVAGWIAVARLVFKRRSWAKTARTDEPVLSSS